MENEGNDRSDPEPVQSLVVVCSYHHGNTEKIAQVFAKVLAAQVKTPRQVDPEALAEYGLIGFGSGIYDGTHHESLLDLAGRLPPADNTPAFIFSTCGIPVSVAGKDAIRNYAATSHMALREKLQSKGFLILGEFICAGFNTNSFLRFFGGLNKGRPDAEDLGDAEEFARNLRRRIGAGKPYAKREG